MPYLQRALFRPAATNIDPLRDLGITSVAERREAGLRASLFGRMFPPHGPELGFVNVFDDMAAFEKYRNAFQRKAPQIGEAPYCVEMYETIPPPGGVPAGYRFFRVAGFRPALGKAPELRQALERVADEQRAAGVSIGRWEQLVGERGSMLRLAAGFPDLAAFEQHDALVRRVAFASMRDVWPLLHEHPSVELWEQLTPL